MDSRTMTLLMLPYSRSLVVVTVVMLWTLNTHQPGRQTWVLVSASPLISCSMGVNHVPSYINSFCLCLNNNILALKFYNSFPNYTVKFSRAGAISFIVFLS